MCGWVGLNVWLGLPNGIVMCGWLVLPNSILICGWDQSGDQDQLPLRLDYSVPRYPVTLAGAVEVPGPNRPPQSTANGLDVDVAHVLGQVLLAGVPGSGLPVQPLGQHGQHGERGRALGPGGLLADVLEPDSRAGKGHGGLVGWYCCHVGVFLRRFRRLTGKRVPGSQLGPFRIYRNIPV